MLHDNLYICTYNFCWLLVSGYIIVIHYIYTHTHAYCTNETPMQSIIHNLYRQYRCIVILFIYAAAHTKRDAWSCLRGFIIYKRIIIKIMIILA